MEKQRITSQILKELERKWMLVKSTATPPQAEGQPQQPEASGWGKKFNAYLPAALVGNKTLISFLNALRAEIEKLQVLDKWEGDPPLILEGLLISPSGRRGFLYDLAGGPVETTTVAKKFKIKTAAVVLVPPTPPETSPTTHLAISSDFVALTPPLLATDAILLLTSIQQVLDNAKVIQKVATDLASGGAPDALRVWFEETFARRRPTGAELLRQALSPHRALHASREVQQFVDNLLSLLHYSPTLFYRVFEIKMALRHNPITLATLPPQERRKVEALISSFARKLETNLAAVQQDNALLSALARSLVVDSPKFLEGVLLHELLHYRGEHLSYPHRRVAMGSIMEIVAEELVKIARQKGERRRIKIKSDPDHPQEFEVGPNTTPEEIIPILDRIAEVATSPYEVKKPSKDRQLDRWWFNLVNSALNFYFDLLINSSIYDLLKMASPLGALAGAYEFVFPQTFGLRPLHTASPEEVEEIVRKFRRIVAEEVAKSIWERKEKTVMMSERGEGAAEQPTEGEEAEGAGEGEVEIEEEGEGMDGEEEEERRGKGERRKTPRLWDWSERNIGEIKETSPEEEREEGKEEKEEGEAAAPKEEEKKGEEEEGKGKEGKEEEERKKEGKREEGEGERREEEPLPPGISEDEIRQAQKELDELLKDILRQYGMNAGRVIDALGVGVSELRTIEPPPWHEALSQELTKRIPQIPPASGRVEEGRWRERRGYYSPYGQIYRRQETVKRQINFIILQDVSGSMSALYEQVVGHIIGWLQRHNWRQEGVTFHNLPHLRLVEAKVVFIPVDTQIHRVGIWAGGGNIDEVASRTLTNIRGGGTDIYGLSPNSVGLYHIVKLLFDREFSQEIVGSPALASRPAWEEGMRSKIYTLGGGASSRIVQLGKIFQENGLIAPQPREVLWVFFIATDHATYMGEMERLQEIVRTIESAVGDNYLIFYLIYTSPKEFETHVEAIEQIWGAQVVGDIAGYPIKRLSNNRVFVVLAQDPTVSASTHQLVQSRLMEQQVTPPVPEEGAEEEPAEVAEEPVEVEEKPVEEEPTEEVPSEEAPPAEEGEREPTPQPPPAEGEEGEEKGEEEEERLRKAFMRAFIAALGGKEAEGDERSSSGR